MQNATLQGNLTVLDQSFLSRVYADEIHALSEELNLFGNIFVNGRPISAQQGNVDGSNCIRNLSQSSSVCVSDTDNIAMTTSGTTFVSLGSYGEWAQGELVISTAPNSHSEGQGISDITTALLAFNKTDIDGRTGLVETSASEVAAHAEGAGTVASGVGSHSEGGATQAIGDFSHAEGLGGKASGIGSHVEGDPCFAEGDFSHAEGQTTHTGPGGIAAHSEGRNTFASGIGSHAEGNAEIEGSILATGDGSHAEGFTQNNGSILASGMGAHAEGFSDATSNEATGNGSHAEGHGTKAYGIAAHSEGSETSATGNSAHSEGLSSEASAESAHSEGTNTTASGIGSHSEGLSINSGGIVADGTGSHVEGFTESSKIASLRAVGGGSHAEGFVTGDAFIEAMAFGSHSEGRAGADGSIQTLGDGSHAEGFVDAGQTNIASGRGAHSEGTNTTSSGNASHSGGFDSHALNHGQYAFGTTQFARLGDAQFTRHVVRGEFSEQGDLENILSGHIITVPNNTVWTSVVRLVGVDTITNDTYSLVQNIRIKNIGGLVSSLMMLESGDSSTIVSGEGTIEPNRVAISYGSSGDINGEPQFTISIGTVTTNITRWVASLDSIQVGV
jgi:hypothetical protein